MAVHRETGSGSARATSKEDLLNKWCQFLCSQHVETVVRGSAGGSGYVVGDLVKFTDASAHLDPVFEVTSVTSGAIDVNGLRIVSGGAFAQQAASATVPGGSSGSGYAVDDILEVQGGTSRLPAKFKVATLSGSAVATVTLFEGGGAYSATPSNDAATVGVGPDGFAGDDTAVLTVTYTPLISTLTNISLTTVTGGGSGANCTITLDETGWTVDERNTNNHTVNSIDEEKTVVLKGDATGLTNKPFIAYRTGTATSGLDTRHFIAAFGLIAHNPSLTFTNQDERSPGQSSEGSFSTGGSFMLCSQSVSGGPVDEMDFWFFADDSHCKMFYQIESGAGTSDLGVYMHHYNGLMDRVGSETESPYPHFCFSSARLFDVDPLVASASITGIAENRHTGTGCGFFYDFVNSTWRDIQNDDTSGTPGIEEELMLPIGIMRHDTSATSLDQVVTDGQLTISTDFFELDRSSASLILRKIPGTTQDEFFLWPLTVVRKPSNTIDPVNDRIYGSPRGVFWISSDDGSGNRIVDFSEDYVTVGTTRYLIFHNHTHIQPYQYVAVEVDV